MKTEEIIEGNKLIAEFMGLRWNNIPVSTKGRLMEYHSSWDWLMLVVEKIESNGYVVEIKKRWIEIRSDNEIRNIQNYIEPDQSKIEAVWLAVAEFIKWHNPSK